MAKRQADIYLTHDNWNDSVQPEERGQFIVSDKKIIEQRTFKIAKRRCNDPKETSSTPNLFAGFNFTNQTMTSSNLNNHNSLNNINGLEKNDASNKNNEISKSTGPTFLETNSTKVIKSGELDITKNNIFKLGSESASSSSTASCSTSYSFDGTRNNSDMMHATLKPVTVSSDHSLNDEQTAIITESNCIIYNGFETDYDKEIRRLNESVYKWIAQHLKKEPHCILSPIFKDYNAYVQKLDKEFNISDLETRTVAESKSEAISTAKAAAANFGITGLSAKIEPTAGFSFKPEASLHKNSNEFSFTFGTGNSGSSSKSNDNNTGLFTIKEPTAKSEPCLLSSNSAKLESSSNDIKPFTFGTLAGSQSNGTGFQFGNKSLFSFTPNVATSSEATNDAEDDGEDVEEKKKMQIPQSITHEADAFYHIRCKLYYMKDKAYKEKGLGILYLKKLDNKTQCIIRADNVNGNVLLNIFLMSKMPITHQRNSVSLVCIANPPMETTESTDGAASTLLIKVKTAENAEELFNKLEQAKKEVDVGN